MGFSLPTREQLRAAAGFVNRAVRVTQNSLLVGGKKCLEVAEQIDHIALATVKGIDLIKAIAEGRVKIEPDGGKPRPPPASGTDGWQRPR
jgi:hypothetical protein